MSNTPSVVMPVDNNPPRDVRFWLIFLSLCVSNFLTALELVGFNLDPLPTIVDTLHGEQFIWAGSAYALGTTALIPLAGGLAEIFGRRLVLLSSLALFATGSALCGAAQSMNMLVAGRILQGLGAGGIISLTQIIVADLVSLRERGSFNGLIAIGNVLLVGATTSIIVALTWGGIQYSWGDDRVLAPLISGTIGLAAFFIYETHYAKHATIPLDVVNTMTGLSGYIQTFLNYVILILITYYMEVYFQARFDVSPIGAGIDIMPLAFIGAPAGLIAGVIIQKTNSYRIPITAGWVLVVVGFGLMSTLDENASRSKALASSVIVGLGTGSLILTTYFPVLAPIPVSKNANALALFIFTRNFGLIWGIAIGGTILQNELQSHLPADFVALFPGRVEIAYSTIPLIRTLPEPLRSEVRKAFAQALRKVWLVATGIACLGFLASLFMKAYPLHTSVDGNWGMEDSQKKAAEKVATL
ncbi:iron permease [Mycena sanguinolenta]|nr:iron permease [Mycena sanguinolenta]